MKLSPTDLVTICLALEAYLENVNNLYARMSNNDEDESLSVTWHEPKLDAAKEVADAISSIALQDGKQTHPEEDARDVLRVDLMIAKFKNAVTIDEMVELLDESMKLKTTVQHLERERLTAAYHDRCKDINHGE